MGSESELFPLVRYVPELVLGNISPKRCSRGFTIKYVWEILHVVFSPGDSKHIFES